MQSQSTGAHSPRCSCDSPALSSPSGSSAHHTPLKTSALEMMKCGRLRLSYQKPLSYTATTPKALQLSSQAPKSQPDVYRQAAPSTTGKDGLLNHYQWNFYLMTPRGEKWFKILRILYLYHHVWTQSQEGDPRVQHLLFILISLGQWVDTRVTICS